MQVTLIRHGKTKSNLEHRYQGSLDDSLCQIGREEAQKKALMYQNLCPQRLVCSPKIRCLQTAEILFPNFPRENYLIEENLQETNFGIFEGKTYEELKEQPQYIEWLSSNAEGPIPDGESKEQMSARCIAAFVSQIEQAIQDSIENIVFVIHGGSIMALMERFAFPKRSFYDYHIQNAEGFILKIDNWSKEGRYPAAKFGMEE